MADIAAKLTGQFAGCLADKIRGPAATTSGPTGSEPTEAPAAAPASAQERTFAPSAAAQAPESLDLMSTVAMPVLKRLAPVVAGDARARPRHAPGPAPPNRDHDRPGAAGDRPAHASHAVRWGA